ncbi:MAG: hypothetical protein IPQ07_31365 [Myxococcales bacterium]|nr:hypothetical protein [Myxococcales bacterium]
MYAIPFILLWKLQRLAIDARRKRRTWHHLAWTAVSAVTTSLLITVLFLVSYVLVYFGMWLMATILVGFALMPLIGAWLVRHVLVRLGAYRLAYHTAVFSRPGKDPHAYALCVAAWALAYDRSGTGEAWVARRRDLRVPLGDAEVITTALIAAARGDIEIARPLMRSALMLAEDHPFIRELAGEWLACDAAERGAWKELADDSYAAVWPPTPMTFFLEGVATRRVGAAGAPSELELWTRWLFAPHRRATRALREAAVPPPPEEPLSSAGSEGEPIEPPEKAPLPRAISAHLAIAQRSQPTSFALGITVQAWDAALSDGATHGWLARRALELDAPLGAVDRALREIALVVTDDLARIADAARLGSPASHGPIGEALGRRLRHGRLDALEAGFNAWAARKDDHTHKRNLGAARTPIDEWREFIALRAAYTDAVIAGGADLRRLAFPHAFTTGSNMAAWLWNQFQEYSMSHAISKWLLDEALVVGDTEAIELGHRNCGLHVRTRMNDG